MGVADHLSELTQVPNNFQYHSHAFWPHLEVKAVTDFVRLKKKKKSSFFLRFFLFFFLLSSSSSFFLSSNKQENLD